MKTLKKKHPMLFRFMIDISSIQFIEHSALKLSGRLAMHLLLDMGFVYRYKVFNKIFYTTRPSNVFKGFEYE